MTAVMEPIATVTPLPGAAASPSPFADGDVPLRRMLAAQGRTLAAQHRMLEALDARREQVDELITDVMPIINAAMLMMMRNIDAVATPGARAKVASMIDDLKRAQRAPAPSALALLRRLRDRDARKGLALAVAALAAVGRAAGDE